jgi:hypothetical protein
VVTVVATLLVVVATDCVLVGAAVITSGTALSWLFKCVQVSEPTGANELPAKILKALTRYNPKRLWVRYLK